MTSSSAILNIERRGNMDISTKNVIIAGGYRSMDISIGEELLNRGVKKLGILGEELEHIAVTELKVKYPDREIFYRKVDSFLTRATISNGINLLKNDLDILNVDVLLINSSRLSDDKIKQIQDDAFYVAVNLTLVGIKLMKEHKVGDETGEPGVIATIIPLDGRTPNKNFPSYNAKKHAITGFMIAFKEEHEVKKLNSNFLAICYKEQPADETMAETTTTTTTQFVPTPAKIQKKKEIEVTKPSRAETPSLVEDVTMDDSDLPGPNAPDNGTASHANDKAPTSVVPSDVVVIVNAIIQIAPVYVLHTVSNGEMEALHFAKYSP